MYFKAIIPVFAIASLCNLAQGQISTDTNQITSEETAENQSNQISNVNSPFSENDKTYVIPGCNQECLIAIKSLLYAQEQQIIDQFKIVQESLIDDAKEMQEYMNNQLISCRGERDNLIDTCNLDIKKCNSEMLIKEQECVDSANKRLTDLNKQVQTCKANNVKEVNDCRVNMAKEINEQGRKLTKDINKCKRDCRVKLKKNNGIFLQNLGTCRAENRDMEGEIEVLRGKLEECRSSRS